MTQLLISVRNADEAIAALAGGADIIDVKEPNRGALGAADPQVWQSVVRAVNGKAPVSVALGELRDFSIEDWNSSFADCLAEISWAKLGLAGYAKQANWPLCWQAAVSALPPHVQGVAVIYADWRSAHAPRPDEVLDAAIQVRASIVLIDTFDKSAGHLLNHLPLPSLAEIADQARACNLKLALAGSLRSELIAELASLAPHCIAVRGAVCEGSREAGVSKQLVERLSSEVRRLSTSGTLVGTRIA